MTAAAILVNGVPLDAAMRGATTTTATGASFWSTPARAIGDKRRDIYEVRLASVKPINDISLDLPQFPYVATFEYWDSKKSVWLPVPAPNGRATSIVNRVSNPARINTQVTQQGKSHPQHQIAPNHWQNFDLQTRLIQTNRIRVILTRNLAATPPKDAKGTQLDYSLGVRSFRVAQKVRGRADVPKTPPVTLTTTSETFASTLDLYKTPVNYALRQNLPRHLFKGGIWKSEPQPIGNAVVPFYVDLRNPDGSAQVLDRVYLEPLYSGATVNMYYSNSLPQGDFETHDYPIEFPLAQLHGDVGRSPLGLYFSGIAPTFVEIDNTAVQWDPSQSWNFMMRFTPFFDSTALPDRGVYTIFDFDAISLRYDASSGSFQLATSTAMLELPLSDWHLGSTIDLFVVYSAQDGLSAFVNDLDPVQVTGQELITAACDVFRFGAKIVQDGEDPTFGNYRLSHFMLKREEFSDGTIFNDFKDDPEAVVELPYDPKDPSVSTHNAVLRFSPTWQNFTAIPSEINPTGFRGGVGDTYADLIWTPIQRDFKVRKGYYNLPRVSARFLKLEFTNLTPQPYDSFAPVRRTVQTFKSAQTVSAAIRPANFVIPPGPLRTNMVLADSGLKFSDTSGGGLLNATKTPFTAPSLNVKSDFSPTEVFYASDLELANRLRQQSPLFGMQPWQSNSVTNVRFTTTTRHDYETVDVIHNTKIAYFIGLKAIKCYRVDYLINNDTETYIELFQDTNHLGETVEWVMSNPDDGRSFYLTTPSVDGTFVFTSATFPSTRQVYAMQFASVQSSLVQLLTDNEFDQTDYLGHALLWNWTGLGDASIESSPDLLSDIGSTIKIDRATPPPTMPPPVPEPGTVPTGPWDNVTNRQWGLMSTVYLSYDGISHALSGHMTTYGDLSGANSSGTSIIPPAGDSNATHYIPGGIAGTEFISPRSKNGRMYAAARVVTTTDLHDDLWLQIVTEDGEVLSENNVSAANGGIYEWYTAYEVGTGTDPGDGTVLDPATPMSVRVIQKTATGDSWYADNISLFEDPILWEFSIDGGANYFPVSDIRNNAHGIFVFPTSGNKLKWRATGFYPNTTISALEVRPWYEDLLSAIPAKPGLQIQGPNMQPLDDYQAVPDDPFFKLWNNPIPQEWFINYRLSLFPPLPARGTPQTVWALPERIVPVYEAIPPDQLSTQTYRSIFNLPDVIFVGEHAVDNIVLPVPSTDVISDTFEDPY